MSHLLPTHRNRTFMLTMNNPPICKEDFLIQARTHKAEACKVALEKGTSGTVHL